MWSALLIYFVCRVLIRLEKCSSSEFCWWSVCIGAGNVEVSECFVVLDICFKSKRRNFLEVLRQKFMSAVFILQAK